MKARIAVLDDEPRMVDILAMLLRREGYAVDPFTDVETALAAMEGRSYDLLLTDLRMPDKDGLAVLERVRARDPEVPVILMTAYASLQTAIEALRKGAFDYVQKPFDNDELKLRVQRALEATRLARENRNLRAQVKSFFAPDRAVAESEAMREVFELARRAAKSASVVLVTGESGTGKELVARAVHYFSPRVGNPFVAVNCKALASGVLESELFGHERGAFTGAASGKPGLFEQAEGGTLFLDEIGDVDPDFQGKLLRVLQEKTVRRVGSTEDRSVDVRVVAATNRDLQAEVRAGRFRSDLYFRLAVIPIHVPPLRDRRDDVLPLARSFLQRWASEMGRAIEGWSPAVETYLLGHGWPGNVRELENAIERGVVLAQGDRLELEDVRLDGVDTPAQPERLRDFLERAATERIRSVLSEVEGRRAEAARRLGVDRATLFRLMRKYGIED